MTYELATYSIKRIDIFYSAVKAAYFVLLPSFAKQVIMKIYIDVAFFFSLGFCLAWYLCSLQNIVMSFLYSMLWIEDTTSTIMSHNCKNRIKNTFQT